MQAPTDGVAQMPSPERNSGESNSGRASNQQISTTYVSPYERADSKSSTEHTPHIPFLERLKALPEIRPIPWRSGQNLPPDKSYESSRVQQRGASLLSTRGQISTLPCTHCSAGLGRFSVCISLKDWFQGACATCVFTSKGNRCSLRGDMPKSAKKAKPLPVPSAVQTVDPSNTMGGHVGGVAKKRKRSAPAPKAQLVDNSKYVSPYQPANKAESSAPLRAPLNSIVTKVPDLDTLLQAEIARGESTGLLEYVQSVKVQKKPRAPVPGDLEVNRKRTQGMSNMGRSNLQLPRAYTSVYSNSKDSLPASSPIAVRPDWAQNVMLDRQPSMSQSTSNNATLGLSGVIQEIQGGINHLQKQLNVLQSLLGLEDGQPANAAGSRRHP